VYVIRCEGQPIGAPSAKALGEGVNLNTLLLDANNRAPWEALAKELCQAGFHSDLVATRPYSNISVGRRDRSRPPR
jgi:hypothetical protein